MNDTKRPYSTKLNFFIVLCLGFCHSSLDAAGIQKGPRAELNAELPSIRMTESGLQLSRGWDLSHTIPAVESFFTAPLTLPTTAGLWLDELESVDTLSSALTLSCDVLSMKNRAITVSPAPIDKSWENLPAPLKQALADLVGGISAAQPLLNNAVDSLSAQDRKDFLEMSEWPDPVSGAVKQDISAARTLRRTAAMNRFNDEAMLKAAARVLAAIDQALLDLHGRWDGPSRMRFVTRAGVILVSGTADDTYSEADLKGVTVLIDAGGHNTYRGRPAFAHEKEIRVVIDFGTDVTVTAPANSTGGAGTGAFGIGVFVAANQYGVKTITTGSFSQGAGVGGVGVLWLEGRAMLTAERFVQGAATFGVGLLRAGSAARSSYTASRSGQGYAFTRGVGMFLHHGDDTTIRGGLVQPDPREPNGSVSLCQGVGFGPRAYAGGGVGLASVVGSSVTVQGSYFSQGAGYWHGLGAFRLRGHRSTLQARRYDMGSGVHSAFGHFEVLGDNNRILNWGVGPAYGWDHAVGSALITGDHNEIQVDWGAATASIGSMSFSYMNLSNSKMKMCGYGFSSFFRDEPSYSLQVLDGTNNELQCAGEAETQGAPLRRYGSPWGMFRMEGTRFNEKLALKPALWPELPQAQTVQRETVDLQQQIQNASTKPSLERVADLVDVAAAFSLDKNSPRIALEKLLQLSSEDAHQLADVLEPAAVDQLIQLSIAIPAYGNDLAQYVLKNLNRWPLQKRVVMINFLRMNRPSTVLDAALLRLQKNSDDKLRAPLMRTMATMLNKNEGEDPGVRALMTSIEASLKTPADKAARKQSTEMLARLPFAASFGLLSAVMDITPTQREFFFSAAPDDLTNSLQIKGATTFFELADAQKPAVLERIQTELNVLNTREDAIRIEAASMLLSTNTSSVIKSGLVALGQIGNAQDAALIGTFLTHSNALVRETAMVALARIGDGADNVLTEAYYEGTSQTRATIVAGLSQTFSDKLIPLLKRGWQDPDVQVQLTALSVLDHLSPVLTPQRTRLIADARSALSKNTNPEITLALTLLK